MWLIYSTESQYLLNIQSSESVNFTFQNTQPTLVTWDFNYFSESIVTLFICGYAAIFTN